MSSIQKGVLARLGRAVFSFINLRTGGLVVSAAFAFAIIAMPNAAFAATSGNGTMTVSPTSVTQGATNQTLTFTFTNNSGSAFSSNSNVTLTVPNAWPAPTTNNNDGRVTVVNVGTGSGSCLGNNPTASVSGRTITVSQTCGNGKAFTITYGSGSNNGVTVPSANQYTFNATSRNSGSGSGTSLTAGSPIVTVNAPSAPDLTVTNTNNVSGNATVNTPFNWVVVITNPGNASATFTGTGTTYKQSTNIVTDDLPTSGATYGSANVVKGSGVTGTINCSISSSDKKLSCKTDTGSSSSVVIPAGATITVTIPVTPTAAGTLVNPKSTGTCKIDPDSKVSESDETNNTCSNAVTVVSAPLTNQTITVTTHAPASAVNGSTFSVAATGGASGNPVIITATDGCSISGGTVTMTSDTTACVVHYNQAANDSYSAAPEVTETTTASAPVPPSGNLILNPSVEAGTTYVQVDTDDSTGGPDHWFASKYNAEGSTITYPVAGIDGDKAVKVQVAGTVDVDGGAEWFFAPVAVTADHTYFYSEKYQSDVETEIDVRYTIASTSPGTNCGVEEDTPANHCYMYGGLATVPAPTSLDTWNTLPTISFVPPEGTDAVTVFHIITTPGTLVTDDYSLTTENPNALSQGYVTLSFDDGWKSQYDNLSKLSGLKATYYIITGLYGSNLQGDGTPDSPEYMSLADITALQNAGMDVGAHTRTHPIGGLTAHDVDLTSEVSGSRQDILGKSFTPVDSLAYPEGVVNPDIETAVRNAGFTGARGIEEGFNDKTSDLYDLKAYEVFSDTSLADVQTLVENALSTKTWVIFFFHQISASCTGAGAECITPDNLQAITSYLAGKPAGTVVTASQGLSLLGATAPANQAPVLDVIDAQNASVGSNVTFTAHATDANNDALTYSASPLPAGATFDTATGVFSWTPAVGQAGATTTTITVTDTQGGTDSQEVTITVVDGAPVITLTGNAEETVSYGDDYADVGATATDLVDGPVDVISTGLPIDTLTLGDKTITYTATDSQGHAATPVTRTVHVVARAVTVKATDATKVFGEVDPAFAYEVTTGTLVGEDAFTGSLARDLGEDLGTYAITQGTLALNDNYAITFVPGTFTITSIPGAITLSNLDYSYDGTAKSATVTTDPTGLATTVTYNGLSDLPINAGTYAVVATITEPGHTADVANGSLVIGKAPLAVTSANQSIAFGEAPAAFSATYEGFVNGEDDTVLDTAPTCDVVGDHAAIGTYDIVCSGGADDNYDLTYTTGTLTVSADPNNQMPVAADQSVSINQNGSADITLAATDAENADLAWTVVDQPAHGTLSGTAPELAYAPDADYYGTDSFTFKVNDGNADSNVATVSISVNLLPTCPAGYTLNGSECEPTSTTPVSVVCPTNTAYDEESGMCKDSQEPTDPESVLTCPEGATLGEDNMCMPDPVDPVAPTCGEGFTFNDATHQCEAPDTDPQVPACSTGTFDSATNMCVTAQTPFAPDETLTCSEGSTLNEDNMCVPAPIEPSAPVCPANTTDLGDGTCQPEEIPAQCIAGYHVDSDICVANVLYIISVSAGSNGSISPASEVSVAEHGSQTFTVSANSGFHISDVLVDGASAGTGGTYEFSDITANHTISASFAADANNSAPAPSYGGGGGGGGGGVFYSYSVSINSGAAQTNSQNVTLTITPAASANQIWISNDPSFSTGSWAAFQGSYPWTLTAGDGVKTVYVRYGTSNSVVANAQASITLSNSGTLPGLVLGASTQLLTDDQITAILNLLRSFDAEESVIDSVNKALHGEVAAATADGYVFTRTLQVGSTGTDVTELQTRLTAEGVYQGPITGYFGVLTQAGVIAYQKKYGIDQVGIVGPVTRASLNGTN